MARQAKVTLELERADVPIRPKISDHHEMGAATNKAMIAAGEKAATEAIPKIRALF